MDIDPDNDDQWLYGDAPDIPGTETDRDLDINAATEQALLEGSDEEQQPGAPAEEEQPPSVEEPLQETEETNEAEPPENEETATQEENDGEGMEESEKQNGNKSEDDAYEANEEEEDDSDDDDINVVIGDIKTSPTYAPLNIKRGGLISTVGDKGKLQQPQTGKFTVDEFEQMGMINGVPAGEYSMDSIEDKPWRKPGADITDYFNYGFNEDTWRSYCERQKRLRVTESGVGMLPLNAIGLPRGPLPTMNDNSKYSGSFTGTRKAGPPPGRRMTGSIDVIGGNSQPGKLDAPKENVIQVMTADRREYSRKPPGFPDLSMPPPQNFEEFQPEFGFNPEPEPFYGGYEPTQDVQWGPTTTAWTPNEIKPLAGGIPPPHAPPPVVPIVHQPPPNVPPMGMLGQANSEREPHHSVIEGSTPPRERERERDHESRSRSEKPKERDRERERSHRRERSRSRSKRHKSRSRSPSHRSHRKKKSRRHDDSE